MVAAGRAATPLLVRGLLGILGSPLQAPESVLVLAWLGRGGDLPIRFLIRVQHDFLKWAQVVRHRRRPIAHDHRRIAGFPWSILPVRSRATVVAPNNATVVAPNNVLSTDPPAHETRKERSPIMGVCDYCTKHRLKTDARAKYESGRCSSCGCSLEPREKHATANPMAPPPPAPPAPTPPKPIMSVVALIPPIHKLIEVSALVLEQAGRRGLVLGGFDPGSREVQACHLWSPNLQLITAPSAVIGCNPLGGRVLAKVVRSPARWQGRFRRSAPPPLRL